MWPTARAEDSECCGNHPSASGEGDSLTGATRNWPTPQTSDDNLSWTKDPDYAQRHKDRPGSSQNLAIDAVLWKTPDANTGSRPGMTATSGGQTHLVQQANNWGTDE